MKVLSLSLSLTVLSQLILCVTWNKIRKEPIDNVSKDASPKTASMPPPVSETKPAGPSPPEPEAQP